MSRKRASIQAGFGSSQTEIEGVWEEIFDRNDQYMGKFKIARMGGLNKAYEAAIATESRKAHIRLTESSLGNKKFRDMMAVVLSKTVLLDWKDVLDVASEFDKDGNLVKEVLLPYSQKNAYLMLKDLPDFYDEVVRIATTKDLYVDEQLEEDVKN